MPSDLPDAAPTSPPVATQERPKEAGEAVASKGFAVEDRRHAVLLDADLKGYQAWLDRMRASGYRPNFVNAHDAAGGPRFAAIAVKSRQASAGKPTWTRVSEAYQLRFKGVTRGRGRLIGKS